MSSDPRDSVATVATVDNDAMVREILDDYIYIIMQGDIPVGVAVVPALG